VRFPGYVNPEKSVVLYSVSWVSVLPSVTTKSFKEPWGLTVNEAFNQSVPVISTDAVGAAAGGLLRNGINGFVVPERDTEALAKAMNAILSDEDLHLKMSQNAREDIRAWTNSKMVEAFASAISSVLPRFVQES
ncbi:MAG: glycosyltransferase family 4 protein, partial [Crenarchaeota archaeon]|nr:glycosyltransferase family 4 protein [Thermoproteota archaeon]